MIKYLWRTRRVSTRPESVSAIPTVHRQQQQQHQISPVTSIDEGSQAELDEKTFADLQVPPKAAAVPQRHWWSWKLQPRSSTTANANPSPTSSDPEKGGKRTERKLLLIGPIYAGCGAALAACGYKFSFIFLSYLLVPNPSHSMTNLSSFFSVPRFHDVCLGCSPRRIRFGWKLC